MSWVSNRLRDLDNRCIYLLFSWLSRRLETNLLEATWRRIRKKIVASKLTFSSIHRAHLLLLILKTQRRENKIRLQEIRWAIRGNLLIASNILFTFSFVGCGCKIGTQDPENFDEEDKSLASAWRKWFLRCNRQAQKSFVQVLPAVTNDFLFPFLLLIKENLEEKERTYRPLVILLWSVNQCPLRLQISSLALS